MKSFLAVTCLAFLAVAYAGNDNFIEEFDKRIVDGKPALPGAFPYQVSLRRSNGFHFCGGSIINKNYILTAAHCLQGFRNNDITVYVGTNKLSEGGQAFQSVKLIPHPKFSMLLIRNDLGLIKLNGTIEYSKIVKAIPLPTADNKKNKYPAVVSGWGLLKNGGTAANLPDDLQYLDTFLLNKLTCSLKLKFPMFSNKKICAFTKRAQGVCNGDSGGPLVSDGELVGIVSYGIAGCAFGFPDIYTRVYSYKDWIEKTVNSS